MTRYGYSMLAMRRNEEKSAVEARTSGGNIEANSEYEAKGMAMEFARLCYKESEGWGNHGVSVWPHSQRHLTLADMEGTRHDTARTH